MANRAVFGYTNLYPGKTEFAEGMRELNKVFAYSRRATFSGTPGENFNALKISPFLLTNPNPIPNCRMVVCPTMQDSENRKSHLASMMQKMEKRENVSNEVCMGSMVGPGWLAQILVSKYEYHQPLYRQEKMFRQQFGVDLSRKTMGGWVEQAAELLKPVYRTIREDLLRGNYLQADETPIRYLDSDVKGKSRQGYLWVYSRPGGDVIFEWRVSRLREGPEEFLKNFRGKLQTDGYAAYESLAKARDDLTLVGCWAHARRGFHEALAETKLAAWFVRQIGQLYAVEKKLREQNAGPALRQAMRVWQSQPVLARLHLAMELIRRRTLPQGLLGQAIDYTLKRWEALTRFVDDGVLEVIISLKIRSDQVLSGKRIFCS